jgi:hypothetical protein
MKGTSVIRGCRSRRHTRRNHRNGYSDSIMQGSRPRRLMGALRLTTALYYTPSGKSIQGAGITPDITVEQPLPPNYWESWKMLLPE